MKQFLIALSALLVCGLCALSAQNTGPSIQFDSVIKDFGKVQQGESLKHVFKFTNAGTSVLVIDNVEHG